MHRFVLFHIGIKVFNLEHVYFNDAFPEGIGSSIFNQTRKIDMPMLSI